MNKYIKSMMTKNQRFRVAVQFKYGNNIIMLDTAIIDTGCNHSHFSANLLLGLNLIKGDDKHNDEVKRILTDAKSADLESGTQYTIGRGVESNGISIKNPISIQEALANKNLKFTHNFENVTVNGCLIGDYEVRISYDTYDVALIGMDFIKNWDLRISSDDNNNVILLACPIDRLNDEYYSELNRLFGL